jgi:long-chain fatty acid transport protein
MFWNPAVMTQIPGIQSESSLTGILPYSSNNATSGAGIGTGNVAHEALVPSGYFSWQIRPQLWLGMSVNSPYGLTETFPDAWSGRPYGAGGDHLTTFNATPSIAYALTDWLSIGAGVQIQYADATLTKGIGALLANQVSITGKGWGYGWTAGVTVRPTPTTTIGIGYRSAIDQNIDGSLLLPAGPLFSPPFSTPGSVSTTLHLPDTVSIGIRQKLGAQWTAMGTVEWSNWSRIGTSNVVQPNGQPAVVLNGLGGGAVAIPFEYKDGWYFSIGAEYQWTEKFAVRGGIGFEKSPISDAVRIPIVADNDRTWLSLGATYQYSDRLSFDVAYSHLFVKSTPIDITSSSNPSFNGAAYTGTVDSRIDLVSVALHYRWDTPARTSKGPMYVK